MSNTNNNDNNFQGTSTTGVSLPRRKILLSVVDNEDDDSMEIKVAKTILNSVKSLVKGDD